MDSETQSRGPGVNKRMWTEDEDKKLIEALVDLKNSGKYNADGGFKPGHFIAVEKILSVTLPNSNLKVDPHIKSRMKTLKSHFGIVHDMLCGHNTSGFGYDDSKKCVVVEKSVWDAYLQSHKGAVQFKNKPFPFYKELCIIFGKDRATGKDAETPADAIEELDRNCAHIENDNEVYGLGDELDGNDIPMSFTGEVSSKKKRKKRSDSVESMIHEVLEKSTTTISETMQTTANLLSRAIEDATVNELKLQLNNELIKLHGLSMIERHKATVKIGCDRDLTQIFYTIDDEEKEAWVKAVIS